MYESKTTDDMSFSWRPGGEPTRYPFEALKRAARGPIRIRSVFMAMAVRITHGSPTGIPSAMTM